MVQLTDGEIFDEQCGQSVCLISFLPSIDEGVNVRQRYLNTLKSVAEANKRQPMTFLWVEAGAQPALESAVQVGGFGYPAAVALSVKKQRFAPLTGAFSTESINSFLKQLSKGGSGLEPLATGLPEIEVTPKWDGKGPTTASLSLADDDDELAALLADL